MAMPGRARAGTPGDGWESTMANCRELQRQAWSNSATFRDKFERLEGTCSGAQQRAAEALAALVATRAAARQLLASLESVRPGSAHASRLTLTTALGGSYTYQIIASDLHPRAQSRMRPSTVQPK